MGQSAGAPLPNTFSVVLILASVQYMFLRKVRLKPTRSVEWLKEYGNRSFKLIRSLNFIYASTGGHAMTSESKRSTVHWVF